jgi:uncharacterized membrane protein
VPRLPLLLTAARWLLGLLAVRVLVSVLANYPSYFPPDFGSLFLEGRERTFWGWYAVAFYAHSLTAPWALAAGLVLLSGRVRRRWPAWHRRLGRVQVVLVLAAVAPSAAVMSLRAFAGPAAGASFLLLSVALTVCIICGWREAVRRRFAAHRRWMVRSAVLLGSAVTLRLVSGAASVVGVSDPETAYVLAVWASWLVPLGVCELVLAGRIQSQHT